MKWGKLFQTNHPRNTRWMLVALKSVLMSDEWCVAEDDFSELKEGSLQVDASVEVLGLESGGVSEKISATGEVETWYLILNVTKALCYSLMSRINGWFSSIVRTMWSTRWL